MPEFTLTPDAARSCAARFKSIGQMTDEEIRVLWNQSIAMLETWAGTARTEFVLRFTTSVQLLLAHAQVYNNIGNSLNRIVDQHQTADSIPFFADSLVESTNPNPSTIETIFGVSRIGDYDPNLAGTEASGTVSVANRFMVFPLQDDAANADNLPWLSVSNQTEEKFVTLPTSENQP